MRDKPSPEQLRTLFLQYHNDKDVDNMMRLYNTEGAADQIINLQKRQLKKMFDMGLQNAQVETLDHASTALFNKEVKAQGQTVAFKIYVEGQLMTTYAGSRAETLLFGKKDERYYFALHIYK